MFLVQKIQELDGSVKYGVSYVCYKIEFELAAQQKGPRLTTVSRGPFVL